jgi:hypothetical protein
VHALKRLTAAEPVDRPGTIIEAFALVAASLEGNLPETVSAEDAGMYLEKYLQLIPPMQDVSTFEIEEAADLLEQGLAGLERGETIFSLRMTEFAFLDYLLNKPGQDQITVNKKVIELMAMGAIKYGRSQKIWWEKLYDPDSQLALIQNIVFEEEEKAIERSLSLRPHKIANGWALAQISPAFLNSLLQLVRYSKHDQIKSRALDFLCDLEKPPTEWQPVWIDPEIDEGLAEIALSDQKFARRAAELIGQVGSTAGANHLLLKYKDNGYYNGIDALFEVYHSAGSLPNSFPASVQAQVLFQAVINQLTGDRSRLGRTYLGSALASSLALGLHVYINYRLPELLDSARILNSIGSALFFGPLLGLGIFLTQLIGLRLKALGVWLRTSLGILIGGLVINFSFVSYTILFLDLVPSGLLILLGSLLFVSGIGIGGPLTQSKILRGILSTIMIALSLYLSWQIAMETAQTPLLYYDLEQPVVSWFSLLTTAVLVGGASSLFESLGSEVDNV